MKWKCYTNDEDNDENDNMLIYQSIWLVAMYVFFEEKKIDCRKNIYNLVFVFIRIKLQNVL